MNTMKKSLALTATLLFSVSLSELSADVTIKCPTVDQINDFKCEDKSCQRIITTTVDVTEDLQIPLTWTSNYFSKKTKVSSLSNAEISTTWDLVCTYETTHGSDIKLKTSTVTGSHSCKAKNQDKTHEFVDCNEDALSKKQ